MTLDQFASLATIIEAGVVIISVYFIFREIRENRKLAQAANTQSLVELSSPLNLELITNRELAELWAYGSHQFDELDYVDQHRYKNMLIWWLILHENIFYQHKEGLIQKGIYRAWENDLETFIAKQKMWRYWDSLKTNFESDFVSWVSEIVSKYEGLDETE